jgi:hypothetical protein
MATKKRDYKAEYKKFQSSTKAKKARAARNKANRDAKRKGILKKGDGNEMAHVKDKNGKVKVVKKTRKANRGSQKDMPGDRKARGKGQKKNQPSRKSKR